MEQWGRGKGTSVDRRRRIRELHEQRRKLRRKNKRLGRTSRHSFARRERVFYDRIEHREQIILPDVFSLSANFDKTVEVISRLRHVVFERRRPALLHFNRVESIEPAAALALVSEIHRIFHLRGQPFVSGTYPSSHAVYNALRDMGFFSLLKISDDQNRPGEIADPGRPIFLRFITDNRANWKVADVFVGIVERHVFQMNDLARQRLVKAIGEAMNNTFEHAHPDSGKRVSMRHRWWMSSWINLVEREVTIVFFDQGVGIPNTLQPTEYESIRAALRNLSRFKLSAQPTDGEMILAASAYRRSGTGSLGRGRGFADMKQFVDVCSDGELRVLSNRGAYHYMSEADEGYSDHVHSLGGTVIEWRFRHTGVVEMKDE